MIRLHRAVAAATVLLFVARNPVFAGHAAIPELPPSASNSGSFQIMPVAGEQWRGAMVSFSLWLGTPEGALAAAKNPAIESFRALTPTAIEGGVVIGPLAKRLAPAMLPAVRNPDALSAAQREDLFKAIAVARRAARPEVEAAVSLIVEEAKSGSLGAEKLSELLDRVEGLQFYGGGTDQNVRVLRAMLAETYANAESIAEALKQEREPGAAEYSTHDSARVAGRTTNLSHLPRAQRRQLIAAEIAAQQPPTAVREVVVLGGGPSGLMSAFNLIKHGARVTIIEQRDGYDRPIHFNIRQSFLDQIAHFDPVLVPRILEKMGTIERAEFVDATIERRIENPVPGLRAPDGRMRIAAARIMMESPSVGQIKVSDFEKVLSDRLEQLMIEDRVRGRRPRVRIIRDAQTSLVRGKDDRYSVAAQPIVTRPGANGRKERVAAGPAIDLGTPDLVVVAEGANSSTRELLSVNRQPTSPETRYVAGYIDRDSGGLIRRRYAETARDGESDEVYGLRQIAVGHSKNGKTWSLVEVPENLRLESREAIRAYFIKEVAKILGISGAEAADLAIEWGPNLFRVQQWIANTAVPAANVVLIGDAVGNAHFLTSGGVMTASVPHQQELERLLLGLAGGRIGADQHKRIYDARVRAATLEWARLGIREFGRQVAAVNFGAQFTKLLADLRRANGVAEEAKVDLTAISLNTSAAERSLEGSPQGEVAWNKTALPAEAARAASPPVGSERTTAAAP